MSRLRKFTWITSVWLLAISFVLLAVPITAIAQSVPGFTVTTFATGITGARAVSTDPAGNVYSMGRDTGTVFKISPAGAVSVLANLGNGFYVGPYFDPVSGDLFASTCQANGSILRINSSGSVSTFVSGTAGLNCPAGFASDASGNIYASVFPDRVVKITPGGIVSTYATGLSSPDGIDFGPSGELYVGNRGTNQVMQVPPGGGVATVFDLGGGISLPLDVLSDSAGNVFAANFGNGTISKVSPAGVVSTFGTGFANPLGLDFDPSGNLFIADFTAGVIYKVQAVDATSVLYGSTSINNTTNRSSIYTIDTDTGAATLLGSTGLSGARISDVAEDPTTGILYGMNGGACRGATLLTIDKNTGAATVVGVLQGLGFNGSTGGCSGGSGIGVDGIAFSPDGTLFAGGWKNGGILFRVDKNTGTILQSNRPGDHIQGLAFSPSGVLWSVRTNRLHTFDTTTLTQTSTITNNTGSWMTDIAFAPDGTLYVSIGRNSGTNNLATVDPSSGALTVVGPFGDKMSGLGFGGGSGPPPNSAPEASCKNAVEECTGNSQAAASIDAGSSDPDGDPISLVQAPPGPYSLGNTLVELTVTDSPAGSTDSCQATVTVVDTTDPTITAPPGATAECTGPSGTPVALGTATANDSCQAVTVTDDRPALYPLGDTTVTFTALDGSGNDATATATVKVSDTADPVIASAAASPNVLWPPNHKMKSVSVSVDASDVCNGTVSCKITKVTNSEADNGTGDGNTTGDFVITGDLTVDLRAERSGSGTGRVYTITVTCTDPSGNDTSTDVTVSVPHSQGGGQQTASAASGGKSGKKK